MKIAILTGSNSSTSASTRLARYVGSRLGALGHRVELFDQREQPLPLYDPDTDEEADTDAVRKLRRMMADADAIVLATPEYHGSLSGILKNALDFLGSGHFDGKMVLSISTAGGAVGVSSLTQMQAIVRNLHGINCPDWISAGGAQRQFDAAGIPSDPSLRSRVERVLANYVRFAESLRA